MSTTQNTRRPLSTHLAFHTFEGDGFEVRRAIPSNAYEAIGHFIFLDHFGPIDVRPGEAKGAPTHPHAGIETLTLLLEGRSVHKDSLGNESVMQPGEVQWMRAGRGVIHDEGPDAEMLRDGGRTHGIQLWLNMPKGHKQDAPAYRHFQSAEIPRVEGTNGFLRLVSGRSGALQGPLDTFGNPFVAHVSLTAGGDITFDAPSPRELAAFVLTGSARIGGQVVAAGYLARLGEGESVELSSEDNSEILVIGGDPLDAPILRHGPFVMNSVREMEDTIRDYRAGKMGQISPSPATAS
jgi:quercetin 2,3-dioxygenase